VCAVCGRVSCEFVGVILCCVRVSLLWVLGSECVLFVGEIVVGLWE